MHLFTLISPPPPPRARLSSLCIFFLPPSLPSPRRWSKGWPRQSICQRLTVLQHMHYTDGCHHSHNDCPLKSKERARGLERIEEAEVKGSWVKITVACRAETYGEEEEKNSQFLSQFHLWIFFFYEVLNSEVDFPLCATESPWFSLSTGHRRICSTLLADTIFNTFSPGLLSSH